MIRWLVIIAVIVSVHSITSCDRTNKSTSHPYYNKEMYIGGNV